MTVLITGGAGYIGSHMAHALWDSGTEILVVDDLSSGFLDNIPRAAKFVRMDIGDEAAMRSLMLDNEIDSVVHFAGSIIVPESVSDPLKYYLNNTVKSHALIAACIGAQVNQFVFSSTAAVYGQPEQNPVREDAKLDPLSPYGTSKLMTEWMLRDCAAAHDFRCVALRYFNVAGADPQGRTGNSNPRATHLLKIACETALGKRDKMQIFGSDYDTADGTCVRDFIHVSDLVNAHLDALGYLRAGGESEIFNCGYGRGYSVLEVIDAMERETGKKLNVEFADRRPGDSPAVVANSDRLKKTLMWKPRHDDLSEIVRTALNWERKLG